MIRAARADDLGRLREIEVSAGEAFRSIGMAAVADDEPPSVDELAAYQRDGRAWVATDDVDRPVAYLLVRAVDGNAHIEQVSVDSDHARRGIGALLIEAAAAWATGHGLEALTLTTFAEVPWNAPYYLRLGFDVVPEADLTDGLRRVRDLEAATTPGSWPRVVMRRLLPE